MVTKHPQNDAEEYETSDVSREGPEREDTAPNSVKTLDEYESEVEEDLESLQEQVENRQRIENTLEQHTDDGSSPFNQSDGGGVDADHDPNEVDPEEVDWAGEAHESQSGHDPKGDQIPRESSAKREFAEQVAEEEQVDRFDEEMEDAAVADDQMVRAQTDQQNGSDDDLGGASYDNLHGSGESQQPTGADMGVKPGASRGETDDGQTAVASQDQLQQDAAFQNGLAPDQERQVPNAGEEAGQPDQASAHGKDANGGLSGQQSHYPDPDIVVEGRGQDLEIDNQEAVTLAAEERMVAEKEEFERLQNKAASHEIGLTDMANESRNADMRSDVVTETVDVNDTETVQTFGGTLPYHRIGEPDAEPNGWDSHLGESGSSFDLPEMASLEIRDGDVDFLYQSVDELPTVGSRTADALEDSLGVETVDDLRDFTKSDFESVNGIGEDTADLLDRAAAKADEEGRQVGHDWAESVADHNRGQYDYADGSATPDPTPIADLSPVGTSEMDSGTIPSHSVEGEVIAVYSPEEMDEHTEGSDSTAYQKFTIEDSNGDQTNVTVWQDSVKFPGDETESRAIGTDEGLSTDLSNEGIHPFQEQVKQGDTVRVKGVHVDDETPPNLPNYRVSTTPSSDIEFVEKAGNDNRAYKHDRDREGVVRNETPSTPSYEDPTATDEFNDPSRIYNGRSQKVRVATDWDVETGQDTGDEYVNVNKVTVASADSDVAQDGVVLGPASPQESSADTQDRMAESEAGKGGEPDWVTSLEEVEYKSDGSE